LLGDKQESLSAKKKLVAINKSSKEYHVDKDARKALGISLSSTVKMKSSQYEEWDVYIQSTSTNRKIKEGSQILYEDTKAPKYA